MSESLPQDPANGREAYIEAALDDLHDVLDESPQRIKAKLRELVPEYGAEVDESAGQQQSRRLHAK